MQAQKQRMYKDVVTWSPAIGCLHGCKYCEHSFQAQLKRQKKNCLDCYNFKVHYHPERLTRIPTSSPNIFMFAYGDFAFYKPDFVRSAIKQVVKHIKKYPDHTIYFQTKNPSHFSQYIPDFEPIKSNVIFLTTIETNRSNGYRKISKAILPLVRYLYFKHVDWERKILTIEPIMDFDILGMVHIIKGINPERIYLGLNSRHKRIQLPEPSKEKFWEFYNILTQELGFSVELKNIERFS